MQRQDIEHATARSRQAAWLALVLTAMVLLTPGAVLEAAQDFIEPGLEALRNWKRGWWPWPVSETPGSGLAIDKIIHASLFAVCGVLASRAWSGTFKPGSIALLLLMFGVMTELAQYVIPGRGLSLGDIVADAAGVLAGVGIWHWIGPRRQKTGRGMT